MSQQYDVVIVGAGMVGAALACLIARKGNRVAVLDREPPRTFDPAVEPGLRVSAVSHASRRILSAAGAWEAIRTVRASPYRRMHVWEPNLAGVTGAISFDSAELGMPELGYIVENELIQHALHCAMRQQQPEVSLFAPALPVALDFQNRSVGVSLQDGRVLAGRLVVGADGAGSTTRELAGIDVRGWDYRQRAVVAHVNTEQPHCETAWQRFMPTGPLALLPLCDGRSSVVWSTTPEHAEELLAMDRDAFADAASAASGEVLGRVSLASDRASFPLRLQHAVEYTRPRLALVGDAAHSVHPLAGLGVNLGFLDAAALAEVLIDAAGSGEDIGDTVALRRYERWRKGENLATMAALDGLGRLFGSENRLLAWVRDAGLNAVDRLPLIKAALARRAMGLAGDLPRLAREA